MTSDRAFLRHTLATLAYRGGKATRGADAGFATFLPSPTSRTPLQVLCHIGDLLDLTHVGQIAMLRRVHGEPIKGESYFQASIETGRVGADQEPAHREFD